MKALILITHLFYLIHDRVMSNNVYVLYFTSIFLSIFCNHSLHGYSFLAHIFFLYLRTLSNDFSSYLSTNLEVL